MVCMVLGVCSFVPAVGVLLGLGAIAVGLVALAGRSGRAAWKGISWGALGGVVFQAILFGAILPTLVGCATEGDTGKDPGVLVAARRAMCAERLVTLGKGLTAYAMENTTQLPVNTGTRDNRVEPTTANNLWLLVDAAIVPPETFVCPSVDDPRWNQPLTDGPKPMTGTTTFSFSYQAVWEVGPPDPPGRNRRSGGRRRPRTPGPILLDDSALVLAADRTNVGAGHDALSLNHNCKGMNVLALDCGVHWETTNTVGIDGDNIFTSAGTKGIDPKGDLTSPHVSRDDSFLVGP